MYAAALVLQDPFKLAAGKQDVCINVSSTFIYLTDRDADPLPEDPLVQTMNNLLDGRRVFPTTREASFGLALCGSVFVPTTKYFF
jgi:hypothetical protein